MKHPTLFSGLFAIAAACASSAPSPEQLQDLAEAQRLMRQDPDAALTITDRLLRQQPDWREARLVAGDGSWFLAQLDRPSSNKGLLLEDAARNFERALDVHGDDPQTWLKLANARYELSQFVEARDAAETARTQYVAAKADAITIAEVQLTAARADLRLLITMREQELATGERDRDNWVRASKEAMAQASQVVGRCLQAQVQRPGDSAVLAAQAYQWVGQNDQAIAELERGIRGEPGHGDVHMRLQDLYSTMGQFRALGGAYNRLVRDNPGVPAMLWYQGRAQVMIADNLRQDGNFAGAVDAYRKALDCYGQYGAMMPQHRDNTQQWVAICELSVARCLLDSGDIAGAREHLDLADAASPVCTTYDNGRPQMVDSFGSHYAGLVFAINRTLSESGTEALQQTLAFNEHVIGRHPGKWGFVYNNAALPARDLGVQVAREAEREGATPEQQAAARERALALWEKSYQYYCEAVKLSPDDPRIVNDCGLMLIYHLDRDFDRARELFERAIAVGQPQLDALPADASPSDRNFLEEAVGDAWQNIAVLMSRHQKRPFEEYKQFCEKALLYYPYQRREAAHMLRNEGRENPDARRFQPVKQAGGKGPHAAAIVFQDNPDAVLKQVREEAERKAAAGDFDGALDALDKVGKQLKDFAPFHFARGEFNLRAARAARDSGGGRNVGLLFADAVTALKKSVELDSTPFAPRQALADSHYETSAFADAAATASALLLHMQSEGGGTQEQIDAAHRVRGQAAAREFIARKQAGKDAAELLTDARNSFRQLEQRKLLDTAAVQLWSTTEEWAGAKAEATNVLVRAWQQRPDEGAALDAAVNKAAELKQLDLVHAVLRDRDDAMSQFYLGKVRYQQATEQRTGGSNEEALATCEEARKCFERSLQKNPGYRSFCEPWLAFCLGQKGNIARALDRHDDAERWLIEAVEMRADQINGSLGLGDADTIKLGLMHVADRHYRARDMARVVQVYRRAAAAAIEDYEIQNNAGLFARDYAIDLVRTGKREQALELFNLSYEAYRRALDNPRLVGQLSVPKAVQLRNDCALMLVHYLKRDWDYAKEQLDAAIAAGTKDLRDNPPAGRQEREDAEMAVGDSYENLALWHLEHSKDFAAAKAAATESLKYHPGAGRPGANGHLREAERRLQGK